LNSARRRGAKGDRRRPRAAERPATSPRKWRDRLPELPPEPLHKLDWPAVLAAVTGPLLLYAFSLSDAVTLEDDGLFLMAGANLGIAHPPGYPLYTLLLHLFLQLPFGTPALMGHFSSALFGAMACGALYGCARLAGAAPMAALVAAWLFGAQEHVWSQAIIAEVYSLNLLLLFAIYGLLIMAARNPERRGPWLLAAACYGLGLANHWPLLVLATPGLALLAWPIRKAVLRQLPAAVAVGAACVALPYAWMVWRSNQELVISFHDPIRSLSGFWHYVSRADYADVDASPSAGWLDRLAFLQWFGTETLMSFTPVGFLLAALGLWALLRRSRLEAWAGIAVWASQSLLLIVLLNFDFQYFQISVFRPYSLVCYGLLAIWTAVGLQVSARMLQRRFPPLARPSAIPALQGAVGLTLVSVAAFGNWSANDRSDTRFTRNFASMVFEQLPENALLLVTADSDTGIFGYYRFVVGEREDVLLLNTQGLVFANRLFGSRISSKRKEAVLAEYVAGTERRVFTFPGGSSAFCRECGARHTGFLVEMLPHDPETLQITRSPAADRYFLQLLEMSPSDAWVYIVRAGQLRAWGEYLGRILRHDDVGLRSQIEPLAALAEQDFHCLMGMLGEVLAHWNPRQLQLAQHWVARMRQLRDGTRLLKGERAEFLAMEGFVRFYSGDQTGAIALLRESLNVHDHPDNRARDALRRLNVAVD